MAFLKNLFKDKKKAPKKPAHTPEVQDAVIEEGKSTIMAAANPILKSFHVSEKSARAMTMNQYTFVVHPHATKTQVRDAVRKSYNVDVIGVNMIRLPSKERTVGRYRGTVAGKRKAIVTLKEGQSIAAAQS